MQVIMPHILSPRRFVMLAQGDPVALINRLHYKGDFFCTCMNVRAERNGKIIDVFVMRIGNNQHVPGIVGHIMQAHESRHSIVLENMESIFPVRNFADDAAKDAVVCLGGMVVHVSIFPEDLRVRHVCIGYKMKMQMWKFLIFPTINDETVCRKMIFCHDGLCHGDQIPQEGINR